MLPGDTVLPNELRPCDVRFRATAFMKSARPCAPSNFSVYYRGDPHKNENALREALPGSTCRSGRSPAFLDTVRILRRHVHEKNLAFVKSEVLGNDNQRGNPGCGSPRITRQVGTRYPAVSATFRYRPSGRPTSPWT